MGVIVGSSEELRKHVQDRQLERLLELQSALGATRLADPFFPLAGPLAGFLFGVASVPLWLPMLALGSILSNLDLDSRPRRARL